MRAFLLSLLCVATFGCASGSSSPVYIDVDFPRNPRPPSVATHTRVEFLFKGGKLYGNPFFYRGPFPSEALQERLFLVKKGDSPEQVEKLFGKPTYQATNKAGTVWEYSFGNVARF